MSNNNSIWFAVDEDGTEMWFDSKPTRVYNSWKLYEWPRKCEMLFPGAIQAITGRTLTWEDEPIEWNPGDNYLFELQRQYIRLLTDELNDVVGMAAVYGWKSTRFEQGKRLRDLIENYKNSKNER